MPGTQAATTPWMRSAWGTTACWDMWAQTSPWNFCIADPTRCSLACILTMRTEHPSRVQIHDRGEIQTDCRDGTSPFGVTDSTHVFRRDVRRGRDQRFFRVVRRSGHIFLASPAGCSDATV